MNLRPGRHTGERLLVTARRCLVGVARADYRDRRGCDSGRGDGAGRTAVPSERGRARTSAWGEVAVPSSMIFVGLVVMWLLILVPAVARRRQEVARPSVTALSGRVLERTPRRDPDAEREPAAGRDVEVDVRHELEPEHAVATRTETEGRSAARVPRPGEPRSRWSSPGRPRRMDAPPRRPRRGGRRRAPSPHTARRAVPPMRPPATAPAAAATTREAAAVAARARYAFRQRVVLILLHPVRRQRGGRGVHAATALVGRTAPSMSCLVGYLAYLRRQVRVEEAIRQRRSAGPAAPRRAPAAEDDDAGDERPDAVRVGRPPAAPRSRGRPRRAADEQCGHDRRRRHAGPGKRSTRWRFPSRSERSRPRPAGPPAETERRRRRTSAGPAPAEADADTPRADRNDAGRGRGGRPRTARAGERHPARLPACVRAVSG